MKNKETMTLNEYQEKAMSTCLVESDNWVYMHDGLCEEVGELSGKVSKAVRKGFVKIDNNNLTYIANENKEEFNKSILLEVGDCLWMIAGLAKVMGVSLNDIAMMNLDKLAQRKKNHTIDGKGDGVTKEERGCV